MKLIDAVKKFKGNPVEIPNCSRNDLPLYFKDLGFKKGAEIGVYRGDFTKLFCESGLTMYAIDPWAAYKGAGRSENKDKMQEENYGIAQKKLSAFNNCKIIRKTSMEALSDFEDSSLDFVYIDGDHRFKFIAEDIAQWIKKVRSGGIISGHDYFNTKPEANNVICHVKEVVDAFVKSYGISDLYIIGEKCDKTQSWIIIKS